MRSLSLPIRTMLAVAALTATGCQVIDIDQSSRLTIEMLAAKLATDAWQPNREYSLLRMSEAGRRSAASDPFGRFRWTYDGPEAVEDRERPGAKTPSQKPEEWLTPPVPKATDESSESAKDPPTVADPEKTKSGESVSRNDDGESSVASSAESAESWNGLEHLDVNQFLDALDEFSDSTSSESHSSLAKLARRNDLVGWNAAILLARRHPQHAASVIDRLSELAETPPEYFRDSGRPSDAGFSPLATASAFVERFDSIWKATGRDDDNARPNVKPLRVSQAMQAAAVEAWCLALSKTASDPRTGLVAVGRLASSPYLSAEIRAEIYRSLARWIAPDEIPHLSKAFEHSRDRRPVPVAIRRAAIDACLIHAIVPPVRPASDGESRGVIWPPAIDDAASDDDVGVRQAYGRWLGVTAPPDALPRLLHQISDADHRVRDESLVSLGLIGSDDAREELQRQAGRPEDLVRAFAVKGLSYFGPSAVIPFVGDSSFAVRRSVAESLGSAPTRESVIVLRELVTDASNQVHRAALDALDDWPDDFAIPVMLHGMAEGHLSVRRMCANRWRSRFHSTGDYRLDVTLDERRRAVQSLASRSRASSDPLPALHAAASKTIKRLDENRVRELETDLHAVASNSPESMERWKAVERLQNASREDVSRIEQFLRNQGSPELRKIIFEEILPHVAAEYRALSDLQSGPVRKRRVAASALAQAAESRSLGEVVAERLREHLVDEQDRLVWQFCIAAIMPDDTDSGAQLALLATNSTWPDVRRLGCEYIAKHPRPAYAHWLIPLFSDPSLSVQYLAVEAAGRCRNPSILHDGSTLNSEPPRSGLKSLLTASDRELRFRTAVALTLLGDSDGEDELLRLVYEPNTEIRTRTVRAMAETGRTRFRRHLAKAVWTEDNDRVKHVMLEALLQLTPPSQRPPELSEAENDDARAEIWATWSQSQSSPVTSPTGPPGPTFLR